MSTPDSINESQHAISDNPGYGYHGTVDLKVHASKKKPIAGAKPMDDEAARAKHYKTMHQLVRSTTGAEAKVAKHYLDSVHGRHLADLHNDVKTRGLAQSHLTSHITKDFASFKKHYKPQLFEGTKETRVGLIKRLVKEAVHSADKKPVKSRDSKGKMVMKMVTRKRDVVDAGGKDSQNETLNKN